MAGFNFKLPDVGEGITEAEIVTWHVAVGDMVQEDAPLMDVMTDKATVEITSPVTGKVVSLNGQIGVPAAIGSVVVVFDTTDGKTQDARPPEPVQAAAPAPTPAAAPAPAPRPAAQGFTGQAAPLASPAVRRRAQELGVKLQFVPGSGPAGRVTYEDLEAFVAGGASAAPASSGLARREGVEVIKVMGLRRKIADQVALSKQRIPHFSYVEEVDMTELETLRARLNATYGGRRPKLTVLPFFVRAVVKAVTDFPQMNATYDDEAGEVHRHAGVDVGIATQTPAGLIVPVLRHAESLDLWQASQEISRLADGARTGKAARDELSGSTITITSLGPLGGLAHTPVINRPEVAIIGPNRIVERPAVVGGQVVVRRMMNLSSSFDHRIIDGYEAAEFVQRIKILLECPALLFVEPA